MATIGSIDESTGEFALSNYVTFPPGFRTVLSEVLRPAQCTVTGVIEKGIRSIGLEPVANYAAFYRRLLGCYAGPPPGHTASGGVPPFLGGQCYTQYRVSFRTFQNGNLRVQSTNTITGKIEGFRISKVPNSSQEFPEILYSDAAGNQYNTGLDGLFYPQGTCSYLIDSIVRTDGQPDNCGDPPADPVEWPTGTELPPGPAPEPGDVIIAPQLKTIDIDFNGTLIPVTFDIGGFTVNPDFSVGFTIDGVEFNINPDGTLSDKDGCTKGLEEIQEALSEPLEGTLSGEDCQGDAITTPYSGEGLKGIQDQLRALNDQLQTVRGDVCSIASESPALLHEQVVTGTSGVNHLDIISLPPTTRSVCVQILNLPPEIRVYKLNGANSDAVYGNVAIGFEASGTLYFSEPDYLSVGRQYLDFPTFQSYPKFCRISLQRGLEFIVSVFREVS